MAERMKRYDSVLDFVKKESEDKEFIQAFEQFLADRSLGKTLFSIRCAKGLSQAELAHKIGCTQSRVSKLEHAVNASISVGDLMDYAKALDLNLSIAFHPSLNAAQSVNYHAAEMARSLDRLAALAQKDEDIAEGVIGFFSEALANMMTLFRKSYDKLLKSRTAYRPLLEVVAPPELIEAGQARQRKRSRVAAKS